MKKIYWLALLPGLLSCSSMSKEGDDEGSSEVSQNVRDSERQAKEIHTLSSLAKFEESISAYYQTENKIPVNLQKLIPKYIAAIPSVETGVHQDSNKILVYPRDVLRDGQIDGSKLKDSGGWGYVFNERQVIIFVDCTHKSGQGHPWYRARGVF